MAKILVVDDHQIVRRTLSKLLTSIGHEVVAEAENGMFGFCEYVKFKPDIVTMDVNMPVLNGLDATRKILEVFPEAKIIIITSESTADNVKQAIGAGAKSYIAKPFTKEKIIQAFHTILDK